MEIGEFIDLLPFKLWPNQEKILREFYSYDYKRAIIRIGSRGGKSTLSCLFTCFEFINACEKYNTLNLLPKQTISVMLYTPSKEISVGHEDFIKNNLKDVIKHYVFGNGKSDTREWYTQIVHSNPNRPTIPGFTNYAVILEDFDYYRFVVSKINAHKILDISYNSVLSCSGRVIIISGIEDTPSGTSMVTELYGDGTFPNPVTYCVSYNTWEINPYITEERLRYEYKYMPQNVDRYFKVH